MATNSEEIEELAPSEWEGEHHAPQGRRSRSWKALGYTAALVLILGTVFIAAAMAILAFLWRGSVVAARQEDAGSVWRAIAFAGWAPRTATICSAALRIAIAAQAAVVVSMVASLLLERSAVPLHSAPFLSIIRAVGVQPATLLLAQGKEVAQSSALRCLPVLCLAALVTMASHFISTILLSDFNTVSFPGSVQSSMVAFSMFTEAGGIYNEITRTAPRAYPRFAEYHEPPEVGDGFDDTGPTYRALMPFQEGGMRTTLRQYEGPASVYDARIICVSPALEIYNLTNYLEMYVTGRVTFDRDYLPGLRVPDKSLPKEFSCAVPGFDYDTRTPWSTSVCFLGWITTDMGGSAHIGYPYLISPLLGGTRLQLVFNVTAPRHGWRTMTGYNETFSTSIVHAGPATVVREGAWAKAKFADAEGAEIAISACFSGFEGYEYHIAAASDRDGPEEPYIDWMGGMEVYPGDWAPATTGETTDPSYKLPPPSFNTTNLRRQLATHQETYVSPTERGILELNYSSMNWSRRFPGNDVNNDRGTYKALFGKFTFPDFPVTQPPSVGAPNAPPVPRRTQYTSLMTYGVSFFNNMRTHWAHVAVFVDSLAATGGSPARALQAWYTTLMQLQYTDGLSRFSAGAEASYVLSAAALVPARWAGFLGVAAIAAAHVLLTGYVVVWYLVVTRHTMLGNGWQAVAQVASNATLPLMWQATGVADRDVKERIRDAGGGGRRYMIAQSWASGRRELVGVDK
jgi:hypothetical protein